MRLWDSDGGEEFLSWREMWKRMYPMYCVSPEEDEPSGNKDAAEMNRLRGVAIVQAAETEAVLAEILRFLGASPDRLTAGQLLGAIEERLDSHTLGDWSWELDIIGQATERRNRLVHDTVAIGYSWREYATGDGGEHVPVISLLGTEDVDEVDLQKCLALQRRSTHYAIEILHHLKHRKGESVEARNCEICMQEHVRGLGAELTSGVPTSRPAAD